MPHIVHYSNTPKAYKIIGLGMAALLFVAAVFMKLPLAIRSGTYMIFRESLKYKALWTTRDMETIEGKHFIVRYTEGNKSDAQLVLQTAEKFYQPIASKYGYNDSGKIPVIVYPSRAELNRNFGWPANESAMGVYWAGVIRVLSPCVWVNETSPEAYQEEFLTSGPMAHEFTHLVVDHISRGNYTRWFTEGLAQYEEYKLTGFEFGEAGASLDQPLYQLADMNTKFDILPNQPLAYRQSYLAVRYLAQTYGEQALKDILQLLAKNQKTEQAITQVTGVDFDKFEADYQGWAKEQEALGQL